MFDLASLTKVIATVPLVMQLVARRRVLLSTPVGRLIPAWRGRDRAEVTLADLLEHSAGRRRRVERERHLVRRRVARRAEEENAHADAPVRLYNAVAGSAKPDWFTSREGAGNRTRAC